MKIALINPPDKPQANASLAPLAIGYLGAFLQQAGFQSDLFRFEGQSAPAEEIVSKYGLESYDLIGLASYTHCFARCVELLKAIRSARSDTVIVLGGYHASQMPEEILSEFPEVDFVIRDEGEIPLVELVSSLRSGYRPDNILNLAYKIRGKITVNPIRSPMQKLDTIPYPRHDYVNTGVVFPTYYDSSSCEAISILHLVTSRGCTKRCTYCVMANSPHNHIRFRSIDNVISEIQRWLSNTEIGHIFFCDPDFLSDADRALKIIERANAAWPYLTYSFESRSDRIVKSADILEQLQKAGCLVVNLGIESLSNSVLNRLHKGTSRKVNELAVEYLSKARIKSMPYIIMFDAESTLDDLKKNITFLRHHGFSNTLPHESTLYSRLEPLPGTTYRVYFESRFGRISPHEMSKPVFCSPQVDKVYHTVQLYRCTFSLKIDEQLAAIDRLRGENKEFEKQMTNVIPERMLQILLLGRVLLIRLPYAFFEAVIEAYHKDPSLPVMRPQQVEDIVPLAQVAKLQIVLFRNELILNILNSKVNSLLEKAQLFAN